MKIKHYLYLYNTYVVLILVVTRKQSNKYQHLSQQKQGLFYLYTKLQLNIRSEITQLYSPKY